MLGLQRAPGLHRLLWRVGCRSHLRHPRRSRQSALVLVPNGQRSEDARGPRVATLEEAKAAVSEELGRLEGLGEAGRGALASGSEPTKAANLRRLATSTFRWSTSPASAGLFFGLLAPRDFALYGLPDKISPVLVRSQHRCDLFEGPLREPCGRSTSLGSWPRSPWPASCRRHPRGRSR